MILNGSLAQVLICMTACCQKVNVPNAVIPALFGVRRI